MRTLTEFYQIGLKRVGGAVCQNFRYVIIATQNNDHKFESQHEKFPIEDL